MWQKVVDEESNKVRVRQLRASHTSVVGGREVPVIPMYVVGLLAFWCFVLLVRFATVVVFISVETTFASVVAEKALSRVSPFLSHRNKFTTL